MNEIHLHCPARQKHKRYCKYGDTAGTAEPNILQRDFTAAAPFRKWSTDITEFKAFGKRLYLSVILDMYNGEIIHYTLTESASLLLYKSYSLRQLHYCQATQTYCSIRTGVGNTSNDV